MSKNILVFGGNMLTLLGLGFYQRNEQRKQFEELRKRQKCIESIHDLFVELQDEQNEIIELSLEEIREEIADVYSHIEVLSDRLEIER